MSTSASASAAGAAPTNPNGNATAQASKVFLNIIHLLDESCLMENDAILSMFLHVGLPFVTTLVPLHNNDPPGSVWPEWADFMYATRGRCADRHAGPRRGHGGWPRTHSFGRCRCRSSHCDSHRRAPACVPRHNSSLGARQLRPNASKVAGGEEYRSVDCSR